jgi:organic radical activating enzyme
MINLQPVESVVKDPHSMIDVVEVWRTFQGEGPFAGMPATFLRLAGCNLKCALCDTDYTTGRRLHSVEELVDRVDRVSPRLSQKTLVVLTGGEPFRQPLDRLINALLNCQYIVQIETNGTLYQDLNWLHPDLHIVCCPKTAGVHKKIANRNIHWKYVVEAGKVDPKDGLPTSVLGEPIRPYRPEPGVRHRDIYVQPVDAQDPAVNEANLRQAVFSCAQFGYRLCLQIHKIIGVP